MLKQCTLVMMLSLSTSITFGQAAPTTAEPTHRHTVGAFGIGVSDLQKSVAFYRDVLGMKQRQTYKLSYMDEVVLAYDGPRGSAIVLMHWTDGSKRNYKDNPVKIVLYVPDPKAAAERIRAAGMPIVREPTPVPTLGNAVVGFAKDPDGYLIELLQASPQR